MNDPRRDGGPSPGPRPTYPIESVDNALRLLGMFRRRQLVRVSEVAEALGIAPSTAHRLLAMLQYHGLVRQDPLTKAYAAGQALLDLGLAAAQGLDVRSLARPELERLSRELEETVHLVVLEGRSAFTIDSVESTQALRIGAPAGMAEPCHCTASGKALLAELPAFELHTLLGGTRLETPTPRAIGRLADLERELEQVRARGYATSFEESEPGIAAVAAVIPEPALLPRAAIGVSAPSFRLTRKEASRVGAAVLETARAVAGRAAPPAGERPTQPRAPSGPAPAYPIESVDNALKLLHLFRKQSPVRLSKASGMLGIARSTAHRLLAMLQYHGFVRQDPDTKSYLVGRALIELGIAAVQGLEVRMLARPALERLCSELDETVHLAIIDGRHVLYIDSVESARILRVGARTGIVLPAHCSSAGKALLATLTLDELRSLLENVRLEAVTPRTITRLDDLERELERVRERGYATSFEESEPGVAAVAASMGTARPSRAPWPPRSAAPASSPAPRLPSGRRASA